MHGILCSYWLYSRKNILTKAAPASHGTCVHDTEHLLKETHSPTQTVNFCKYYKGIKMEFYCKQTCQFLKSLFGLILLLLGYIFNEKKNSSGWLNLTCVDNSLPLANYTQKTCDFLVQMAALCTIWLIFK